MNVALPIKEKYQRFVLHIGAPILLDKILKIIHTSGRVHSNFLHHALKAS